MAISGSTSGTTARGAGIYLLHDDGQLVQLAERAYDSEAILQELIANYPSILAGDQMGRQTPRRWLLVCREMAVPSDENGSDRWAVDHLFLDRARSWSGYLQNRFLSGCRGELASRTAHSLRWSSRTLFSVYTSGKLYIPLDALRSRPPFNNEHAYRELVRRLNDFAGGSIREDAKYPPIPLTALGSKATLQQFSPRSIGLFDRSEARR